MSYYLLKLTVLTVSPSHSL